jgi:hypothetical protein
MCSEQLLSAMKLGEWVLRTWIFIKSVLAFTYGDSMRAGSELWERGSMDREAFESVQREGSPNLPNEK